jgi:hypothetical protein
MCESVLLCQLFNSAHCVSRSHLTRARTKVEDALFGSDVTVYLPQLHDIRIKIRVSSALAKCGVACSSCSNHGTRVRFKCVCVCIYIYIYKRLLIDALSIAANYLALVKLSL